MKSQDSLLLLFYVGALLRHPKARALPFAGRPPEEAREGPAPVYPDAITLPESDYSLAQVGSVLHISKAELHRSHNRLQDAALLKLVDKRPPATGQWINFPNAKEWILYGIRYAHPARRIRYRIAHRLQLSAAERSASAAAGTRQCAGRPLQPGCRGTGGSNHQPAGQAHWAAPQRRWWCNRAWAPASPPAAQPHPAKARLQSLLTHGIFGLGLYAAGWATSLLTTLLGRSFC